jgi:hypothetical protein
MAETHGRGAWTAFGKDNGSIYYEYIARKPFDGSTPEKGSDYEAVHLGVKAIEDRLVSLGYDDGWDDFVADGVFKVRTKRMVRRYQRDHGFPVSGIVGATTGSHLFGTYIAEAGLPFRFDSAYVYGIMRQESAGDPGAVGWMTPGDRGLFQFNTLVQEITYEEAHGYVEATDRMLSRFNNAWQKYKGKGEELRIDCAILQHKDPSSADKWFATGVSPGPISSDYVSKVRAFSATAP